MHHWDRDSSGRLQRVSALVEQGCEIGVHSEQMDPLPTAKSTINPYESNSIQINEGSHTPS